jgi:NAD(P)-dependent dehydrogenase (short-subunit alcohol dehydrogenase family)
MRFDSLHAQGESDETARRTRGGDWWEQWDWLGRSMPGTADEVAQVILMLMTNDYMTGEVVHVDGGGRFV